MRHLFIFDDIIRYAKRKEEVYKGWRKYIKDGSRRFGSEVVLRI